MKVKKAAILRPFLYPFATNVYIYINLTVHEIRYHLIYQWFTAEYCAA